MLEEVVAGTDRIELIPDPEEACKCTLHGRFLTSNGHGEHGREVVDHVFVMVVVVDGAEESWAAQGLGLRLAKANFHVDDLILSGNLEDLSRKVMGGRTSESVLHHADPDGQERGVACCIRRP